jgi:tetratricopeptide (TPR) repeat protein
MKRDEARAKATRGIALHYLGRLEESLPAFRSALSAFEKLKMWEEYAAALGNTGFCLAAMGRKREIARLYREAPPSSKNTGTPSAVQVLRVTICRGSSARVSPLPEYLFAAANEPAAALVAAAKVSVEEADKVIRSLDGDQRRPFALLYAAQKGCQVVPAEPVRMLELSGLVFEEADSLLDAKLDARTPISRELVQAEAAILESYSHLQLGHNKEAREAAENARALFSEGGDVGLGRAFCDFYGGQAAFFARDFCTGEKLLKKALRLFAEFGQDHLVAWAQGALGTLFVLKGSYDRALHHLDFAVGAINPAKEPERLVVGHVSRGTALAHLGRYDESRGSYARALMLARRLGLKSHLHGVRNGLATLDFLRGQYMRASNAFADLARDAEKAGYDVDVVFARLYIAECLGRLGFAERMAEEVASLRADQKPHPFAASPAMEELFSCLDQGSLDADVVGHVRRYLEDTENGIQRPYRRLRMVG